MKTLYLTSGSANICVDTENNTANMLPSLREAIHRIYLATEPMHVVYIAGEYKRELDVDTNDLIITFFTDDFKNRLIVVKNEDWVENLVEWNKKEEEAKLKWASERDECPQGNCSLS